MKSSILVEAQGKIEPGPQISLIKSEEINIDQL